MSITIAVDAMGGDHGATVVVPAAVDVLEGTDDLHLLLVGDRAVIESEIDRLGRRADHRNRLRIHHASQRVEMGELPAVALRNKKDSSMRVAIDLVKRGDADAWRERREHGRTDGDCAVRAEDAAGDRPSGNRHRAAHDKGVHPHVLDLGANVDSTPGQLLEFAVMGSVLVSAVDNLPSPRVGLLNIGEEPIKGNERVKETAQLLAQSNLNYVGFVEGDDIYAGKVDVVVCDGFVGNVALKTSEGVARMISHFLRQEFTRNALTRFAGLVARPVLRRLRARIDPRRYNGASLLGLRGTVVKSHGGADRLAFAHALREAAREVENNVPQRISEQLGARLMAPREAS